MNTDDKDAVNDREKRSFRLWLVASISQTHKLNHVAKRIEHRKPARHSFSDPFREETRK